MGSQNLAKNYFRKIIRLGVSIITAIIFCAGNTVKAQPDTTGISEMRNLYNQFNAINEAIISGDGTRAAEKSTDFIKALNTIDYKLLSEGNHHILLKDASIISETTIAQHQKKALDNLAENMNLLARKFKLIGNSQLQNLSDK